MRWDARRASAIRLATRTTRSDRVAGTAQAVGESARVDHLPIGWCHSMVGLVIWFKHEQEVTLDAPTVKQAHTAVIEDVLTHVEHGEPCLVIIGIEATAEEIVAIRHATLNRRVWYLRVEREDGDARIARFVRHAARNLI
ncbi:MAG: hypothetical protein ACRELY_30240 [Polyangiaceae bacterium]